MNSPKIGSVLLVEGTIRDNQIILDLFNNTIAEAHTLNMDYNFDDTFNSELKLLPPMQVGM